MLIEKFLVRGGVVYGRAWCDLRVVRLKTRNEDVSTVVVIYLFHRPQYIVLTKGGVYHTQKKTFPAFSNK